MTTDPELAQSEEPLGIVEYEPGWRVNWYRIRFLRAWGRGGCGTRETPGSLLPEETLGWVIGFLLGEGRPPPKAFYPIAPAATKRPACVNGMVRFE